MTEPSTMMQEYAERKAREQRAADRERWMQYACAALAGVASRSQTVDNQGPRDWAAYAEEAADAMLKLERQRFDGEE
jgi:hypothetical protein